MDSPTIVFTTMQAVFLCLTIILCLVFILCLAGLLYLCSRGMILWSVRGWGLNLLLVISEKGTSIQSKFNPVHPVLNNTVLNNRQ